MTQAKQRTDLSKLYDAIGLPPLAQIIPPVFGYAVFQITGAISRLGVPDAIGDGTRSATEIAEAVQADPPFLHRILRAAVAVGLLRSEDDEHYALTPLGALFRADAPWQGAPHDALHGHPAVWNAWGSLTGAVRSGTPAFIYAHGKGLFDYLDDDPELAKLFHDTMATGTAVQLSAIVDGYDFSRFTHVTDVGGGDGTTLSAILLANPHLRGTVFDQENAVRYAPAVLERNGLSDRADTAAGSFFDSVVSGADLFVLKSVLHDWDDARAVRLLTNIRAAMRPDSRLAMFTWLMPEPGVQRDPAEELSMAIQDIELMVMTRGETRRLGTYEKLFAQAGLKITNVIDIPCPMSLHAVEASPI
ncbi:MAG: methyltransferase [Actinoplanes sp.]